MTTRILLLGVALLVLLALFTRSDAPPLYDDALISFAGLAGHWQDSGLEATPETIADGRFDHRFTPWREHALVQGPGQQWLRIRVDNPEPRARALLVVIESNLLARADLVYRDADGLHTESSGRALPPSHWPTPYRYPALPFTLDPGSSQVLYLRYEPSAPSAGAVPFIVAERDLLARAPGNALFSTICIGIVAGISLYVLLVANLSHEWKGVGYYTALMLTHTVLLLANNGLLARLGNIIADHQFELTMTLGVASRILLLQFVRSLLETASRQPLLDRGCLALMAAGILLLPVSLLYPGPPSIGAFTIYSLICYLFVMALSLLMFRRGEDYAAFFSVGAGGFLFFFALSWLSGLGWIEHSALTVNAPELASCTLGLVFALLLAHRLEHYRTQSLRLQAEADIAQAESRAKSELLAVMSHEIRTPLNGVLGMAELLQGTELNDTQRLYLNTVQSSGRTLLTVIDDILDFSKAEAGKLSLKPEPFNLDELVEAVITPFRRSSDNAVQLIASIAPEMPVHLHGDPIRLQQIIGNLLSNAFKFTEHGSVELRIEPGAREGDRVQLRGRISDTGIGIGAADLHRLFKPFSQIDHSPQRRFGGTGLGLIICRQLLLLMGGRIAALSTPGRGATFTFEAWLELNAAPEPEPAATGVELRGRTLLAVDDREDFLRILREQGAALGVNVVTVNSPARALAEIRRVRPDIVILDLDMPGLNGFALDRAIAAEADLARLPRLLLTASCNPPDTRALAGTGFIGAFSKPASMQQLCTLLTLALRGAAPRERAAVLPERPLSALRVLVAEDNAVNCQVIDAMLRRLGIAADMAPDGAEAVVLATVDGSRYDLILMDCEMPVMNGYEAARRIRCFEREQGLRPTRIVALSAHALAEHRHASLEAGMDDHLAKPVSLAALDALLAESQEGWPESSP